MKTLIDRINEFENGPSQSVEKFNEIFPLCKLDNLSPNAEVEIGELADSDTTRWLLVGTLTIKHSFRHRTGEETKKETQDDDSEI